jgi:hypothetical protein
VEHILKAFENRVLRRIFEPNREKVTGGRRKLHIEELHNLWSSPNVIRMFKSRRMRWPEYVACTRENKKAYEILARKPEGKRSRGRPRHRWSNIKMEITRIEFGSMD